MLTIEEIVDKERSAGLKLGPFERFWLLEHRCPERVRRYLELARKHPHLVMARQGLSTMDINDVNTTDFIARNTSASELNMINDSSGTASGATTQACINQFCAISPNDARAGKSYLLEMFGVYGNTSTPTMIFTPRWGTSTTPGTNITLGASTSFTSITGTTGLPYYIDFRFDIRTAPPGPTLGTGKGRGIVTLGIPATSTQVTIEIFIGGTAATIDTTGQGAAGCGLTMNLTWGTSSASNTSTCEHFLIQSRN